MIEDQLHYQVPLLALNQPNADTLKASKDIS